MEFLDLLEIILLMATSIVKLSFSLMGISIIFVIQLHFQIKNQKKKEQKSKHTA